MSRAWLDDKNILIISKPLVKMVGLNASIALRRVKHWLDYNEDHKQQKAETHFQDGRWWCLNGYGGWVQDLEIMTYSTVRRTFTNLEALRLLISSKQYNRNPKDETKWWSIDYDHVDYFSMLWQEMGSPIYREGNRQTKEYQAFVGEWYLRLAGALVVVPIARTLLTVDRVQPPTDPAHGGQGTLLTVDRDTLLTVDSPPAHGEHTYPRESSEQKPEESQNKDKNNGAGAPVIACEKDSLNGKKILTEDLLTAAGVHATVAKAFAAAPVDLVAGFIKMARDKQTLGLLDKTVPAYVVGMLQSAQKEGFKTPGTREPENRMAWVDRLRNSPYAHLYANAETFLGENHGRGAETDRATAGGGESVAVEPAGTGAAGAEPDMEGDPAQ